MEKNIKRFIEIARKLGVRKGDMIAVGGHWVSTTTTDAYIATHTPGGPLSAATYEAPRAFAFADFIDWAKRGDTPLDNFEHTPASETTRAAIRKLGPWLTGPNKVTGPLRPIQAESVRHLREVGVTTSADVMRRSIEHVLIQNAHETYGSVLVATDGHSICIIRAGSDLSDGLWHRSFARAVKDRSDVYEVALDGAKCLYIDGIYVAADIYDDGFPPFDKVVPKDETNATYTVETGKAEQRQLIAQLDLLGEMVRGAVVFKRGGVHIAWKHPSLFLTHTPNIHCKTTGKHDTKHNIVGAKISTMLKTFKGAESIQAMTQGHDGENPVRFDIRHNDRDVMYLIMPFRWDP